MLLKGTNRQRKMEFVYIEDLVPKDHILRKIDKYINFSFINDLCRPYYCENNGRPAIEPEIMFKMLFIGYLFGIRSETRLVEDVKPYRERLEYQIGKFGFKVETVGLDAGYYSTVQLNVTYDKKAKCPRFLKFLEESMGGDMEQVALIQEMLGYFLIPVNSAQKCFVKVRSSHRIRGNAGEPLSQPPYGYMKSPDNPKFWIIDEETAQIVRSVFKMCIEGKGNETIARILQENKVLVPMAYWQSKGFGRGGKKTQSNPYKWCKTTIAKMLARQEYCGDVINFKTYSKNFKNKARIPNPKESWSIFKDVHEPIIEREMFEHVQELVKK